mgnify:CR=1 FL=1
MQDTESDTVLEKARVGDAIKIKTERSFRGSFDLSVPGEIDVPLPAGNVKRQ